MSAVNAKQQQLFAHIPNSRHRRYDRDIKTNELIAHIKRKNQIRSMIHIDTDNHDKIQQIKQNKLASLLIQREYQQQHISNENHLLVERLKSITLQHSTLYNTIHQHNNSSIKHTNTLNKNKLYTFKHKQNLNSRILQASQNRTANRIVLQHAVHEQNQLLGRRISMTKSKALDNHEIEKSWARHTKVINERHRNTSIALHYDQLAMHRIELESRNGRPSSSNYNDIRNSSANKYKRAAVHITSDNRPHSTNTSYRPHTHSHITSHRKNLSMIELSTYQFDNLPRNISNASSRMRTGSVTQKPDIQSLELENDTSFESSNESQLNQSNDNISNNENDSILSPIDAHTQSSPCQDQISTPCILKSVQNSIPTHPICIKTKVTSLEQRVKQMYGNL